MPHRIRDTLVQTFRHSGARPFGREPGIQKLVQDFWIPGPALAGRPGMTKKI
jgi:hypothetical protein